jgi:hypothetical protein
MPRGYRCVVAALVGWLSLAGAHPLDQPAEREKGTKSAEPIEPPAPIYAPYPDKDAADCYEAVNHDSAGLCAQWRAAIAAEKAASAAQWADGIAAFGAVLSFASVILVLFALSLTRHSNRIARLAFKESRLSGQRAYRLAADTSAAQLRPYVHFTGEPSPEKPISRTSKVKIRIKNFGQTPAWHVRVEQGEGWFTRPLGDSHPAKIGNAADQFDVLGPGDERPLWFTLHLASDENWHALKMDKAVVVYWCSVHYALHRDGEATEREDIRFVLDKAAMLTGELEILGHGQRAKLPPEDET